MPKNYSQILRSSFERFSILSAVRTFLPTVRHYTFPQVLKRSEKVALFTMNIFPPMMTLWHHCARKALGDAVDIVIFDCSGTLNPKNFPGCTVQKFLNPRHTMKCDAFTQSISRNRKICWICDDDVFLLSNKTLEIMHREFADPNTACVSFQPRTWWEYEINGRRYEPVGTYCMALNRQIVWDKERLSFAPQDGNKHVSKLGEKLKRYDSFDKANEVLLQKNYRCYVVPEAEREELIAYYSGLSSAVMLLHRFKGKGQMEEFLLTPQDAAWKGSTLYTVLSGLIALSDIIALSKRITGRDESPPAMLSRERLLEIWRKKHHLMRSDADLGWIEGASEKLREFVG